MRVLVGIVTNLDPNRLDSVSKIARTLELYLESNGHDVTICYSSHQGPVVQGSPLSDLAGRFLTDLSISITNNRINARRKHLLRLVWRFLLELSRQILRKPAKRTYFLWRAILHKHLVLIDRMILDKYDWLVVLEDDVIADQHSDSRINELLIPLLEGHVVDATGDSRLHVNFGGNFESVFPESWQKIAKEVFANVWQLNPPLVDTACGYALNRSSAEAISDFITSRPLLRTASVDYFFNLVFKQLRIDSFHIVPNVFKHGSRSGEFNAWSR